MMRSKSFDPACLDLADHFLTDSPEAWRGMHRQELAFALQQAVEDYFAANEDLSTEPSDAASLDEAQRMNNPLPGAGGEE